MPKPNRPRKKLVPQRRRVYYVCTQAVVIVPSQQTANEFLCKASSCPDLTSQHSTMKVFSIAEGRCTADEFALCTWSMKYMMWIVPASDCPITDGCQIYAQANPSQENQAFTAYNDACRVDGYIYAQAVVMVSSQQNAGEFVVQGEYLYLLYLGEFSTLDEEGVINRGRRLQKKMFYVDEARGMCELAQRVHCLTKDIRFCAKSRLPEEKGRLHGRGENRCRAEQKSILYVNTLNGCPHPHCRRCHRLSKPEFPVFLDSIHW